MRWPFTTTKRSACAGVIARAPITAIPAPAPIRRRARTVLLVGNMVSLHWQASGATDGFGALGHNHLVGRLSREPGERFTRAAQILGGRARPHPIPLSFCVARALQLGSRGEASGGAPQ